MHMRAAVLILAAGLGPASPVLAQEAPAALTVTGAAEVSRAPDRAFIDIAVLREAETAQQAMDALRDAADDVIARLTTDGVPAERIRTAQLSLQPIYEGEAYPGRNRIGGYRAETALEVRIDDLDRLGSAISSAVGEGANAFGGLRFALADPAAAEDEALGAAVAAARRKADALADAAGLSLGDPIRVTERQGGGPRPMMMRAAEAGGMPIATGEIQIGAEVEVVYALD